MALSALSVNATSSLASLHGIGIRSYSYVPGFFLQDNLTATGIPAIPPRFGLIDDSHDRWDRLFSRINGLNHKADRFTSYKLIMLARHGEGFHNVAEAKYGTPAWNDKWSKLNGDGVLVWGPDANLTDTGRAQAAQAGEVWKTELKAKIPLPGKFLVSPLTRALSTLEITFSKISTRHRATPLVMENCREVYGVHTCDMRRTKTYIRNAFREFDIERGFSEHDLLWTADVREPDAHVAGRAKQVFDSVFEDKKENFVLITAHGGFIGGAMATVGRPNFGLATGGILPVVVKSVESHKH